MTEEELQAIKAALDMNGVINMEVFYWWCTAFMLCIHAGFLAYEMGARASRTRSPPA